MSFTVATVFAWRRYAASAGIGRRRKQKSVGLRPPALEGAAPALRGGTGDDRVRAMVIGPALRRLSLMADLETGLTAAAGVLAGSGIETHG